MIEEVRTKAAQVAELCAARDLDAVWLQRVSSFAWATAGAASYVNLAATYGAAQLLIMADGRRFVITNSIEAPRLEREEALGKQGWELRVARWHESNAALAGLTLGLRVGSDGPLDGGTDLTADIARLRARLSPPEHHRLRELGSRSAAAMDAAIRAVRPGMTELEIAARLAAEAIARGVQPNVNLVATDERIFAFRHPLPTEKRLAHHAMLVLGGRRRGLCTSITRLVHFGRMPDDLRRRAQAVAHVDAVLISATRPGRTLGEVLGHGIAAYAATGFPDEWHLHHQGGLAGYEPREQLARPDSTEPVCEGQAFAWNPSVAGAKAEDTILVGASDNEILTATAGWPEIQIEIAGGVPIARPATLEIE